MLKTHTCGNHVLPSFSCNVISALCCGLLFGFFGVCARITCVMWTLVTYHVFAGQFGHETPVDFWLLLSSVDNSLFQRSLSNADFRSHMRGDFLFCMSWWDTLRERSGDGGRGVLRTSAAAQHVVLVGFCRAAWCLHGSTCHVAWEADHRHVSGKWDKST